MKDLQKEFIPYDRALRIKALGFDEPCLAFYNGKHLDLGVWDWEYPAGEKRRNIGQCPSAPTFSAAFRWFREKYNLDGEATRYNITHSTAKILGIDIAKIKHVYVPIINGEDFPELEDMLYFLLKEEAELACLDKLIEIAESKSE